MCVHGCFYVRHCTRTQNRQLYTCYMYIYTCKCMLITCMFMHVHICVYIYIHMYVHVHVYMYICVDICMCICLYTCTVDMLQALWFLKQEETVVVPLCTYLLLVICVVLGFRDSGCRTVVVELSWLQLVMPYTVRNHLENVKASTRQVERGHGNPVETPEIVRESYKARTLYHPVNLRNAVPQ